MDRKDFCTTAWDGMVALYGEPGIAALCISLQETYAADVPLLLFLAQADHVGLAVDQDGLTCLIAIATEWRDLAVRPLRSVRIALKAACAGEMDLAFRDRVKAAEIDAERTEVARLGARFAVLAAASARAGMAATYLRYLDVPDHVTRSAISAIAGGLDAPRQRLAIP